MSSPAISKELLEYLQRSFPNKLPDNPVSPEQLGVLVGQQKVINHLQAQLKLQEKTVLAPGTN